MRNAPILFQIGLVVVSLTVVWFYVYPTFTNISDKQDQVSEYDVAIKQASELNQLLQSHMSSIDAIATGDREALHTYLPDTIDPIVVQRDLFAYAQRRSVALTSLMQETDSRLEMSGERYFATFGIKVVGSYDEIKDMLYDIERNNYPLHVDSLQISRTEGTQLEADIVFTTYAFNSEVF